MDLSKILNLLSRYLWLLVLAAVIAGLTTFLQLNNRPVEYRATTDLLIGPSLDSPSPDLNSLRIGGQLGQTYAEVLNTGSFIEAVNAKLDQKVALNDLQEAISTRQSIETRLLTITVTYPDPNQAVAIANAAAQTLLELSPSQDNITASVRAQMSGQSHQLEQLVNDSQTAIKLLESELSALRAAQMSSPETVAANLERQNLVTRQLAEERSRMSDALRTLATVYQILMDTNTNQMEIIQPATSAAPVDRQLWIRAISSAVGGLIFALILIFVAEYFDDRLRFPAELSKAAGVQLLSTINRHPRLRGSGLERLVTFARPASEASNRYREVAAKLLFMRGKSTPYTLLLSSVGSKTGAEAAVAAGNLAVAFAQAGYKVVLVDAQVDNPILTNIFRAGNSQGLADLVTTKPAELQLLPFEQVHDIRFLPIGLSSEERTHALLNPINVATLLQRLQNEADIVLVAGSAISRFGENLTLASQVNAVILVARPAEATRKMVNDVVENFQLMNINLAGVIFDHNPVPFISRKDRRTGSVAGRGTSNEALQGSLAEQTTKS